MIARLIPLRVRARARALRGLVGCVSVGFASLAVCAPVSAQDQPEGEAVGTFSQPYIEVNQVVTAELSPGDDVLTFTQISTGIDTNMALSGQGFFTVQTKTGDAARLTTEYIRKRGLFCVKGEIPE